MKIIIWLIPLLILISGCNNPYQNKINENQAKINAYLIDNANIDRLNECTKLDSCNGWKCLCDTYVSEEEKQFWCEEYKNLCVNNICDEIKKEINETNFMNGNVNDKYSKCIFKYPKVVELSGIEIKDVNDEIFGCLADYRNKEDIPDDYIKTYTYIEDKFFDEEGSLIKC